MKDWFKKFFTLKHASRNTATQGHGLQVSLDDLILMQQQAYEINLVNPQRVLTDRSGGYLSRFKGRGIDFEEVREYQPGDDVRLIDWGVTARTGKPHTKIFHEERERPVYVIVDLNAHMFFGTKVAFKSVIAAKIAALIAWATVKNGDRIGGIVYGGENCHELKPKSRSQGVIPLLKILCEATQTPPLQKGCCLEQALLKLRNVVRPGSLIFIMSDFATLNEASEKQLGLLSKHNQIVANFIYDPLEQSPPPSNYYSISDGVNRTSIDTSNPEFCRIYRKLFDERLLRVKEITNRYRIPVIHFKTDDAVVKVLKKGLGGI